MRKAVRPEEIRFAVLAVDVAAMAVLDGRPQVLLIPIHLPPDFLNARGLPGGLVRPDETAEAAAARYLSERAGLRGCYSEQLHTFSGVARDPRGRVVSVAYLVLVPEPMARRHAIASGGWWPVDDLGVLAYDHNEIVAVALERFRMKLQSTTIARHLLGPRFTLSELQAVYEGVLGRAIDKRNFRKKLIDGGIVMGTGKMTNPGVGRPSQLYRFAGSAVDTIGILSGA